MENNYDDCSNGLAAYTPSNTADQLKKASIIFLLFSLGLLVLIGLIGGLYTRKLIIKNYYLSVSTVATTPAEANCESQEQDTSPASSTLRPAPTECESKEQDTPSASPSPSPQSTAAVDEQVPPDASPPPTPTPIPTPLPKAAALFTAGQNFFILWLLSAVFILFPAVLLVAFAFQLAPRLMKNLRDDFKKLGINDPLELIKLKEELTVLEQEYTAPKDRNKDEKVARPNTTSAKSQPPEFLELFSVIQNPHKQRTRFVELINDYPDIVSTIRTLQ